MEATSLTPLDGDGRTTPALEGMMLTTPPQVISRPVSSNHSHTRTRNLETQGFDPFRQTVPPFQTQTYRLSRSHSAFCIDYMRSARYGSNWTTTTMESSKSPSVIWSFDCHGEPFPCGRGLLGKGTYLSASITSESGRGHILYQSWLPDWCPGSCKNICHLILFLLI